MSYTNTLHKAFKAVVTMLDRFVCFFLCVSTILTRELIWHLSQLSSS